MSTQLLVKYFALFLLLACSFSCSKDDDGNTGEQGDQGITGETGENGLNCWDIDGDGMGDPSEDSDGDGNWDADDCAGETGAQGDTGDTGADGNANVEVLKFDATEFMGLSTSVAIPELTQTVLENDAVLSYVTDDGINWVPLPCPFNSNVYGFSVHVTLSPSSMKLLYSDMGGNNTSISTGDLQELKVVIIESTIGKASPIQELEQAGIAVDDYRAVCDFYSLNY